jgi:acyl carrier protein
MQRQPEELYELEPALADVNGAPMLIHLDGFIDAGAAGRLLTENLLENLEHQVVARFDSDRLLDYRSRRPLMTFESDHWASYQAPALNLYLVGDRKAAPFLLLSGPEPDHEWELFAAAVGALSDRLELGPAVTYLGIPAGTPHTRPLGVLPHATRPGLVASGLRLPSELQVPGSAAALIELRFGQADRDAIGFAVQVPHYLSQASYPGAALALQASVSEATGLDLPTDRLREAVEQTNTLIARQVADSSDVAELVRGLERQYDAARADSAGSLLAEGEQMPTADEIAEQFEQFLADRQRREENP